MQGSESLGRGSIAIIKHFVGNTILRLGFLALFLCTFSYYARLQNFTIRPIKAIARHANHQTNLGTVLKNFKEKKQKDLEFVRPAALLSALLVVGMFSWSSIDQSFWVAKMFLYWSLSLSVFALISSTIDQLLEWIPASDQEMAEDLAATISLLVQPATMHAGSDASATSMRYSPKWLMVYVWQCPAMLMSWSWVFWFAGFILYILTPVIPQHWLKHEIQMTSGVVAVYGIVILNFVFCNYVAHSSLSELPVYRDMDDTNESNLVLLQWSRAVRK